MEKRHYVRPEMLIESFIPTQCVAANCGNLVDYPPVSVPSSGGVHICTQSSCGHTVQNVKNYDSDKDNFVSIFNSWSNCEIRYDIDASKDVVQLGRILTGTGSWNSHEHKMVIEGVQIPS